MPETGLISELLDGIGLRSASFIVTVYGDVVVPRGGVLWTGTLIEVCAGVGINESLVRTAVSWLVAAQRLRGERVGRRSYYHLDASAHQEFEQAAVLLFGPEAETRGWQILHVPDLTEDAARLQRMGHMGGQVFIRPDRGQRAPEGALTFHADDPGGIERIAQFWDLSALQERYIDMIARFGPLDAALKGGSLSDEAALVARLLLVHVYRNVMLRDPRLPQNALPPDWKGQEARALFRRLYRRLSPSAERHIAARFEGVDGNLPARTTASEARIGALS